MKGPRIHHIQNPRPLQKFTVMKIMSYHYKLILATAFLLALTANGLKANDLVGVDGGVLSSDSYMAGTIVKTFQINKYE